LAEKAKEKAAKKPSGLWRRVKVALALMLVGGSIAGLAFGFAYLDRDVRALPMYQMTSESLRLIEGPTWMTPAILADLDVRDRLPERFSLLDPDICQRVAKAYEQVVWVERVSRVVKMDPRADPARSPLEVTLKFRRPVAYVQGAQGYYLVDGKGIRLPGVYTDVPCLGKVTLLMINGVDTPPPDPGHPWFDPSLEAGVAVADVVEPYREKYRVTRIDVANVGGRRNKGDSEILLYTKSIPPTRIKWGKAPSPEAEILQEKTLAQKVSYLNYVYEKLGGRVDGVLDYIDVPNEIICRRTSQLTTNDRPPR
jgi:hypothetical protein